MIKRSTFRYFKTSPGIIRLAVMLYIRFPLWCYQANANQSLFALAEDIDWAAKRPSLAAREAARSGSMLPFAATPRSHSPRPTDLLSAS